LGKRWEDVIYGRVVVPYRPIKVLVIITVPVGSGAGQILVC